MTIPGTLVLMDYLRECDGATEIQSLIFRALGNKGDYYPRRRPAENRPSCPEPEANLNLDVLRPALLALGWTPPKE